MKLEKFALFAVLIVLVLVTAGCWIYPHYTEVDNGEVFGYSYKGNTALLDVPDAQVKQTLAAAINQLVEDYKSKDSITDDEWQKYGNRLDQLRQQYLMTHEELNKNRLYQGAVVNELGFPARVKIQAQNGNVIMAFDLRANESRPLSLPRGTYIFLFRVDSKSAQTTLTIGGDEWTARVYSLNC